MRSLESYSPSLDSVCERIYGEGGSHLEGYLSENEVLLGGKEMTFSAIPGMHHIVNWWRTRHPETQWTPQQHNAHHSQAPTPLRTPSKRAVQRKFLRLTDISIAGNWDCGDSVRPLRVRVRGSLRW